MLAHPAGFINDVVVAGVSGGRTSDEKVPRAWIVLSQAGKRKGGAAAIKALEAWCRQNLAKQKWLRGGFEIVNEVRIPMKVKGIHINDSGSELSDSQVTHREGFKEGITGCIRTGQGGRFLQVEIVILGLC